MTSIERLSGWGRYPSVDCRVERPRTEAALKAVVASGSVMIARGNGRAYGDSALNRDATLGMSGFDHMLDFDPQTGVLTVEAGVLLGDIVEAFLPRGWFPPVTPGTKFVTVGGMIAADVHGKNHHRDGSFGGFVAWFDLLCADGEVRRCSVDDNADLFRFTIGGMGLTGVILRVAFRLVPVETAWIRQKMLPAAGLDQAIAQFEEASEWTYSVAWIDCLATGANLGRSLVMLGEHARLADLDFRRRAAPFATPSKRRLTVPFDAPGFTLNRYAVRAFNALYYRKGKASSGMSLVDWDSYFYPLDAINGWNRIYGRRGFAQFQCVIPLASTRAGMAELLRTISAAGQGSFLAVLKRLGPQTSAFSFPMEGYTLALDFPVGTASLALLERLDAITLDHGGRFYLAKDARMSASTFERADGRVADMRAFRRAAGADNHFASLQSMRLGL
ncbi:FAD-binding oxidoreductase [Rhizobium sp. S-51]|uniref:FAD-binding oxidoreductase n=1 Tax=Rhizobium terricola TaxID=2728849 RepID=A0A7Y0FWS0_9HYPH|nr:FAD-binding oxidoreductase [Rhizobium terricola]NML74924.1 FAD-binding oxidoreductase [Rhizobium terricola]